MCIDNCTRRYRSNKYIAISHVQLLDYLLQEIIFDVARLVVSVSRSQIDISEQPHESGVGLCQLHSTLSICKLPSLNLNAPGQICNKARKGSVKESQVSLVFINNWHKLVTL